MAIFVIFFFFFFPLIESYALCRQLMGRAADERTGRMDRLHMGRVCFWRDGSLLVTTAAAAASAAHTPTDKVLYAKYPM